MKVIKDFRNDLLKRREVEMVIEADNNPGFSESGNRITKEFNVALDNVAVKAIRGKFGSNEFLIEAFIYDSVSDLEKIEPKPKVKAEAAG